MVLAALINPPVNTLPPVMLALADTTLPNMLEPVIVDVADTSPPVKTLPPVTFALTDTTDPK